MNRKKYKYYPNFIQAVHLVILYLFIQTLIDFPLAVIDYYKGTEYLYNPIKNTIVNTGSVVFILMYGFRKTKNKLFQVFPLRFFNPLIILPVITFLWAVHNFLTEINFYVDKILPMPSWFMELFTNIFENDYGWFGSFLKVVIIAPVIEELIFRGIIMHGFMRNMHKVSAIFFSALLFALFHLNPWQFPATFLLGLLLGWLMVRSNNILLCIIGHAMNNLLVFITISFYNEIYSHPIMQMETNKLLYLSGIIIIFSIILIYLLSFKRKKRRNP